RGFSHSLCFALLIGLAAATATCRRLRCNWFDLWGFFFVVTASHGILDALTNGGSGVAFFWPVEDRRYFFPWRPVQVSPIGLSFLSSQGVRVLWSEFQWMWLPLAVVVGLVEWRRAGRREGPS